MGKQKKFFFSINSNNVRDVEGVSNVMVTGVTDKVVWSALINVIAPCLMWGKIDLFFLNRLNCFMKSKENTSMYIQARNIAPLGSHKKEHFLEITSGRNIWLKKLAE